LYSPWQSGFLGQLAIASEAVLLGQALDDVFGPTLLQLGRWGGSGELWQNAPSRRPCVCAPQVDAGVDIVTRLSELPVSGAGADAVILAHALETVSDAHALLREADRVLMGEGTLIVLGFRPISPWGWRAKASRRGFPPGSQRLVSERRVRDWLKVLGYELERVRYGLYCLPFAAAPNAPASIRRGWIYPFAAGVYLLKARKRLYGVTPLRPRKRRAVLGGALEPTA
jgi:SAM-dependent methyltransferase